MLRLVIVCAIASLPFAAQTVRAQESPATVAPAGPANSHSGNVVAEPQQGGGDAMVKSMPRRWQASEAQIGNTRPACAPDRNVGGFCIIN